MSLPSEFTLIGVPGAGKTTAEQNITAKFIEDEGIHPTMTRMFTYRLSVKRELHARTKAQYGLKDREAETICQTLHGYAYGVFNSTYDGVNNELPKPMEFVPGAYHTFAKECGHDFKPSAIDSPERSSQLYDAHTYYRGTRRDLRALAEREIYPDLDYFMKVEEDLEDFKRRNNYIELYDCMEHVINENYAPNAALVTVDEAQDLTPLMGGLITAMQGKVDHICLGADPNQSLYSFYGASPEYFNNFGSKRFVLPKTHRLHQEHFDLSKKIISTSSRYSVPDVETKGAGGKIHKISQTQAARLTKEKTDEGNVLHLARTNYICKRIAHTLAEMGIPFGGVCGWEHWKINLYNALQKAARNQPLKADEIKVLRTNTTAYDHRTDETKYKKILEEASKSENGTMRYRELFNSEMFVWHLDIVKSIPRTGKDGDILIKQIAGLHKKGCKRLTFDEVRKISVMTIHGAKGLEAETVFLYSEIPQIVFNETTQKPQARVEEGYVWYVGTTRTLKNLYIVQSPNLNYDIPTPCMGWN